MALDTSSSGGLGSGSSGSLSPGSGAATGAGYGAATAPPPGGYSASAASGAGYSGYVGGGGSGLGNALDLGALGLGAGALGYMMLKGPSPLPTEYAGAEGQVPGLLTNAAAAGSNAQTLFSEGQQGISAGQATIASAAAGNLTPSQQATVNLYTRNLDNNLRQQYMNMGRNPDTDTSFAAGTADNAMKTTAMTQSMIQTTVQIGLGQIQTGMNLQGQSSTWSTQQLNDINAANNVLFTVGQANLTNNQNYSNSLSSAFSSVGTLVGGMAKLAPLLAVA